ncbi:amidase domain-containing protein [Actinoallomurus sp. NPDC052274]|uniref:fibronectin type III domain-containing protein n=1 Tax=Actinoallomurus sp. NPDC052274 TaxID=3155420 RepID=UPI00341C794B
MALAMTLFLPLTPSAPAAVAAAVPRATERSPDGPVAQRKARAEGGRTAARGAPSTTAPPTRTGPPGGSVRATMEPTDRQAPGGLQVVTSTAPTLSAVATDPGGAPLDYTFQLLTDFDDRAPVRQATVTGVPSGRPATLTLGALRNPGVYGYRVRTTNGRRVGDWSPVTWAVVDAPGVPTELGTNLQDPASPVLTGLVARPSGMPVTGWFFLYDDAGRPVGGSPLGVGAADGGERISLRVPDGLTRPGTAYTWTMKACVQDACGAATRPVPFQVPQTPPALKGTASTTLTDKAMSAWTGRAAPGDCAGTSCALTADTRVRIGGTGSGRQVTLLKVDPSAVPRGARITSATLRLGRPTCAAHGGCPASARLIAAQLRSAPGEGATGADVVAASIPDAGTSSTLQDAALDLTDLIRSWRHEPATNTGIAVTSDSATAVGYDLAKASVEVTYIPGTAPGAVSAATARQGDGGALVTWAPPADSGAAAPPLTGDGATDTAVTGYDVQVLDHAGHVVRTLRSQTPGLTVAGLTDGAAYTIRVRARNGFGAGAWTTTGAITPVAVPGGTRRFLDLTTAYVRAREGLIEGGTSHAAVESGAVGDAIRALLAAHQNDLLDMRGFARGMGSAQLSSTVRMDSSLVTYSPADRTVTVRADLSGTKVYADGVGTGHEHKVRSEYRECADFVFGVDAGDDRVTMLRELAGPAVDAWAMGGEINAVTKDQAGAPEAHLGPDEVFAAGKDAAPDAAPGAPAGAAHSAISHSGMVGWAVRHIRDRWQYRQDCTNFMSKVMHYGGGAHYISGWYTNHSAWWRNTDPPPLAPGATRSWTLASANHDHFSRKHHRVTWRRSYAQVRVGDVMWWDDRLDGIDHMSMVTYKSADNPGGIYIADHGLGSSPTVGYDAYRPLAFAMRRDRTVRNIGYASLDW